MKIIEPWEKSKAEELKKKNTRQLEVESLLIERLKKITDKKKPGILEKLVKVCDQLNTNYRQLQIFSKVDYNCEINEVLKRQIEYYEQGLIF